MDMVQINLPLYAARYLMEMCERERARLIELTADAPTHSIGAEASWDSLEQIECSIPKEVT